MSRLVVAKGFGGGVRRDMSGKLTYTVGVQGTAGVHIAGGERKRDTSSSGQHGVLEQKSEESWLEEKPYSTSLLQCW